MAHGSGIETTRHGHLHEKQEVFLRLVLQVQETKHEREEEHRVKAEECKLYDPGSEVVHAGSVQATLELAFEYVDELLVRE